MKKLGIITLFIVAFISLSLAITSCDMFNKLPSSKYEKVKFAFNGVEKSFSNKKRSNNLKTSSSDMNTISPLKRFALRDNSDALSIIDSIYTSDDSFGDIIDELEYTEPPMVQFQCLKKVLEEIGKNYEFGTKYYDVIEGVIYIDTSTFSKVDDDIENKDNYKYNYSFTLSISIDVDSSDLIMANVTFNINFKNDKEEFTTRWYVYMELDYDMSNTTPNYTLSMYTSNDEHEIGSYYTYEYDYVEVKDNKISEWRKFCLEANKELIRDNNHESLESYVSDESFKCEVGTPKWYKNSNLRKVTRMTDDKMITIGDAYYSGIGLNSKDIDSTPFISKEGTKTSTITNVYTEFSNILRQDLIYNLLRDNDDKDDNHGDNNNDNEPVVVGIIVRSGKSDQMFENVMLNDDPMFMDIIDQAVSPTYWSNGAYPVFYFVYSDNEREEGISYDMLKQLNYSLEIGNNSSPIEFKDKVSDVLLALGESASKASSFNLIISVPNTNVSISIPCVIGEEIKEKLGNFGAKDEIEELGFPMVDEASGYKKLDNEYLIEGVSEYYTSYYMRELEAHGFHQVNEGYRYAKVTEDKKLLEVNAIYSKEGFNIYLKVRDNLSSVWDYALVRETINNPLIDLAGPEGSNVLYEYIREGDYKRVIVYGLTNEEKIAYIDSLEGSNQFVTHGLYSDNRVLRVMDMDNSKFYELPIVDNYSNLEISLSFTESPLLLIKYQVNDGEIKTFTPTYSEETRNITYTSEVIYLKGEDVIEFYGTESVPLNMVEIGGAGYDEFEPYYNTALRRAPFSDGNYYTIVYFHDSYRDEIGMLYVQFMVAPDPNNPKK